MDGFLGGNKGGGPKEMSLGINLLGGRIGLLAGGHEGNCGLRFNLALNSSCLSLNDRARSDSSLIIFHN